MSRLASSLQLIAMLFAALLTLPVLRAQETPRSPSVKPASPAGKTTPTVKTDAKRNGETGKQPDADTSELTTSIDVSGHAMTHDSLPVKGAKISLVSTNGIDKLLAETTTDANGCYTFRDVKLPCKMPGGDSIPSGTIQVFGEAEGFGIAWHGMRFFHPMPRPEAFPKRDQWDSFFQGEAIEMNLEMRAAKSLLGTVADASGKPVANVKISLSTLDYLDTEDREFHHNFREFWAMHFAPAKYREAVSGADGRFEIAGLPDRTAVVVRINHPDYADLMFVAAMTDEAMTEHRYIANSGHSVVNGKQVSSPIWETRSVVTSPLDIELVATRRIVVRVVHEETQLPAKDIRVMAASGAKGTKPSSGPSTGAFGTTGEDGRTELKLPPGEYRIVGDPPKDSDSVRTYDELIVESEQKEQSHELKLKKGCVLIFEAIDAGDGSGISGVSFWEEFEDGPRKGGRSSVQSNSTMIDNPVTNDKGELRAVVKPGTRNYGIGFRGLPNGYKSDPQSSKQTVECKSGKTVRLQFKLSK